MAQQTLTDVTPSGNVATHDVGMHSMAGTSFWTLLFSFLLFLVSFSTMGWQRYQRDDKLTYWIGLWSNCICDDVHVHDDQAWFKASQAMFTLALICMIIALAALFVYMFIHRVPKSVALLVACVLCFMAFSFLLIGVCVFGSKTGEPSGGGGHQSYSFVLTTVAMIFTLVAALLVVNQMHRSGMFGARH